MLSQEDRNQVQLESGTRRQVDRERSAGKGGRTDAEDTGRRREKARSRRRAQGSKVNDTWMAMGGPEHDCPRRPHCRGRAEKRQTATPPRRCTRPWAPHSARRGREDDHPEHPPFAMPARLSARAGRERPGFLWKRSVDQRQQVARCDRPHGPCRWEDGPSHCWISWGAGDSRRSFFSGRCRLRSSPDREDHRGQDSGSSTGAGPGGGYGVNCFSLESRWGGAWRLPASIHRHRESGA